MDYIKIKMYLKIYFRMARQTRTHLLQHTFATGMLLGLFLFLGACTVPSSLATSILSVATNPANGTPIMTGSPISASGSSSNEPIATSAATDIHADVVLTDSQHQQLTTVKVGQIINVSDFPEYEWSVSYRPQVLLALTLPEEMKKPGAGGWFFRVVAPGNTEIVLESIPLPCPGGTPCPPMRMGFVFPIHAEP
jgi:hypothetical protein